MKLAISSRHIFIKSESSVILGKTRPLSPRFSTQVAPFKNNQRKPNFKQQKQPLIHDSQIEALLKDPKKLDKAVDLFQVRAKSSPASPTLYSKLFKIISSNSNNSAFKNSQELQKFVDNSINVLANNGSRLDDPFFNSLFRCFNQQKQDTNYILYFFRKMKEIGKLPNQSTYEVILEALAKIGDKTHVLNIFKEMKSEGFKPTKSVYASLTEVTGREKDYPLFLEFLEQMTTQKINMNTNTFSYYIDALIDYQKMDIASVIKMVLELKQIHSIQADIRIYNKILTHAVNDKTVAVEDLHLLINDMNKSHVPKTIETYNLLLNIFTIRNDEKILDDIMKEIVQNTGIQPTIDTFRILIEYFARNNSIKEMITVYGYMRSKGFQVPSDVFNSMFFTLLKHQENLDEINPILEDMKANRMKIPNQ